MLQISRQLHGNMSLYGYVIVLSSVRYRFPDTMRDTKIKLMKIITSNIRQLHDHASLCGHVIVWSSDRHILVLSRSCGFDNVVLC